MKANIQFLHGTIGVCTSSDSSGSNSKKPKIMKVLCSLVAAIAMMDLPADGQITLNAGDSYTFEFSSLPLVGPTNGVPPSGSLYVNLAPGTLSLFDLETIRYELFEDAPTGTPIASMTVSGDRFGSPFLPPASVLSGIQDLQGSVRITLLSPSSSQAQTTLD